MRETLCAIKLLLNAEDAAAAVKSGDSTISLSSPVMQALQKVRGLCAAVGRSALGFFCRAGVASLCWVVVHKQGNM